MSTSVFTAEDDLVQALERGEIDYGQYRELIESVQFGVSRRKAYLLDAIPNLSEQSIREHALESDLQAEQAASFLLPASFFQHGFVQHRWSHELERDGRQRYRNRLQMMLAHGLAIDLRTNREYSGSERIVYRSISQSTDNGLIREWELGNYTTRFGLGSVIGYRGKLFHACDQLAGESLLFPDYGGFNGARVESHIGGTTVESILAHVRDESIALTTAAGRVAFGSKTLPEIIAGLSRLRNRNTDAIVRDLKLALFHRLYYSGGRVEAEIMMQTGYKRSFAGLLQGRHRFERADITYAAWAYGDRYLSLSGGGRSGAISRSISLEEAGFSYHDRRAGQEGLTIRAVTSLNHRWQTVTAISYYGFDRSNFKLQALPALIFRPGRNTSLRVDCLLSYRKRPNIATSEQTERRWRIEGRFQYGDWRSRVYIALEEADAESSSWAGLVQVRRRLADGSTIDGQVRISEFRDRRIRYWSGRIQATQMCNELISMEIRLGYRYNVRSSNRHYPQVELGTTVQF